MIRGEEQTVENRELPGLFRVPEVWIDVGAHYEAQGVHFPIVEAGWAVRGEGYEQLWLDVITGDTGSPEEIQERIDRALAVRDEIEAFERPELLQGIDYLLKVRRSELALARGARSNLRNLGWEINEATGKLAKTSSHRQRLWVNEAICRLYDVLRPAFDEAWPDLAGVKVPGLLRTHIRQILGVFFHSEDLQDRLIENTIRNHLKT